ncbi:LysR family transcriptional regulator [Xanthomonas sp. AmX2]|uniref:LysR family transcriptional regulator n=1 Tax=Xanthomonas sp. TaxID=29446 RepID=UPI0019817E35|nr:LysR family transcriptional regulator [Xanthomonas sp.]MBN6152710.1 LysR family transcriptional regulator [Xanthomonas sp.]
MLDLNDVAIFVEVVRHGSFAAAARQTSVPANTLSRRVQQLEDRIGTRLMQRSTRQLTLTNAGKSFYERCVVQVDGLVDAGREVMRGSEQASGWVRIAAPSDFFDHFKMAWVAEFLLQHPHVRLDFVLSDEKPELISERIDVAFRGGVLEDSGYVGRQLVSPGKNRLVASAGYLNALGAPSSPEALEGHHAVSFPRAGGYASWRLSSEAQQAVQIRMPIRVSGNSVQTLRSAAIEGLGIALLPHPVIKADLESGLLLAVLGEYWSTGYGLNVLYPSRKHLPLAVSLFIDLVAARLSSPTPAPVPHSREALALVR